MPDLILMPKPHTGYHHTHNQDSAVPNCMSHQMPYQYTTVNDMAHDLVDFLRLWDDEVHTSYISSPKYAFWSFGDIKDWVKENATDDVYVQAQASGIMMFSISKQTIEALIERFKKHKDHHVFCQYNSQLLTGIKEWMTANCSGKFDIIEGIPTNIMRPLNCFFKEEVDAMLFTVKWKGYPDLEFL